MPTPTRFAKKLRIETSLRKKHERTAILIDRRPRDFDCTGPRAKRKRLRTTRQTRAQEHHGHARAGGRCRTIASGVAERIGRFAAALLPSGGDAQTDVRFR